MPPQTNAAFRNWLKSSSNMKLSSDAAVRRITYEGITNYRSLLDFDKESIEALPKACSKNIEAIEADEDNGIDEEVPIPGANINSIAIRRLVVATQAVKYYVDVGQEPNDSNMHYTNVLSKFKTNFEAYSLL